MRGQNDSVDQLLARIAASAHGVVTRRDLLAAEVSPWSIDRRIHKGTLHVEFPGVYRVGHQAPSTDAHYMAAVKACGDQALLCGRAARHLHRILKGAPPPPEVVTPKLRQVRGIKTRRGTRRAIKVRGIPVTTVPETIVDLAADLSLNELARVCHEAGVLYRTTPSQVEAALRERPRAPGATNLRKVMRGEVHVTLSTLERAFLKLLEKAELALPKTNRPAGGRRVDCRWPDHRLTVELDSYRFHHTRHAWEQDRRREREARSRGDEFRRYTYGDVLEDPRYMLAELRALLA